MSSDYLKAIAAGGEFDQTEAIRELARMLIGKPRPEGSRVAVSEAVAGEAEIIPPLVDAPEPPKKKK